VLGFPANEFGQQEPGTDAEIKTFCTTNYGVTFPMFSKVVAKGEGQHPLYGYLTGPATDAPFAGEIRWNFTKFLIGRDGTILNRFEPKVAPGDSVLLHAIDSALAQKVN
jgi:glutathione peroxidase